MAYLIHQLVSDRTVTDGDNTALVFRNESFSYSRLWDSIRQFSGGLLSSGLQAGERVAVYLPKQPETVVALFGTSCAGGCFVPVNPLLKPRQVSYILNHCQARILITSLQRLRLMIDELPRCPSVHTVIVVNDLNDANLPLLTRSSGLINLLDWGEVLASEPRCPDRCIDNDRAAILYTSGSTGQPRGVVLSHRNLVTGGQSVAQYLKNTADDRLLAVLPFSFDAGLSQLTTAFSVGASVVPMDYLLPQDVPRAVVHYRITGLGAVPPLWNQLLRHQWPGEVSDCLRYVTSTGGAMPQATTEELRRRLPRTDIFLMYGLTEAFRSTYLPPEQIAYRPTSIGKAIPNTEILVVNEAGEICGANEPGELVHRGALVALGYWNDPERTAERFRPCPGQDPNLPMPEIAVWSGDQVVSDEEGYLYFVGRSDCMIKTSGYRVSPTEIEEVAYGSGLVSAAAAMGVPDPMLGQIILLAITPATGLGDPGALLEELLAHYKRELPAFMQPGDIIVLDELPHNPNGKIDRRALEIEYSGATNPG